MVEINDEWETYTVVFSVNYPALSLKDEVFLDIAGTQVKESPDYKHQGMLPLAKAPRALRWLGTKYGKPM